MPSTVIRTFTYDGQHQTLVITFQSGRVYRYEKVPEKIYRDMKAAFSKGEFFNAHIRDRYGFIASDAPAPE